MGDFVVELDAEKAPGTVANFLKYVRKGHYDAVAFHRVIDGFMVQTGGFALTESGELHQKPTDPPIQNEADNGLTNVKGTLAMARTGDPHSASAQFFINLVDNAYLNHRSPTPQGWGYTVFGKVVQGMDVVEAIGKVPTEIKILTSRRPDGTMIPSQSKDVPVEVVLIRKATVIGDEEGLTEEEAAPEEGMDPELAELIALHPQLKDGLDYLAENKTREGVTITPSGLQFRQLERGGFLAKKPTRFDEVTVHYKGKLVDGTEFDSSYKRGEPTSFRLDKVIPGWTEGMQMMSKGSTAELVIPYNLAYGPKGIEGVIPPYSTLIFEIKLLKIN